MLFRSLGSLSVGAGQAASAKLGQAPSRTVVVNSTEREQMLYYFPLDAAFGIYSPSPLSKKDARANAARIEGITDSSRSSEDWLVLAEADLGVQSRAKTTDALNRARAAGLDSEQAARADLIDAWLASQDRRWTDAVSLFDRARPRLDGHRAAVADMLRFIAAKRADPDAELPLPAFDHDQPAGWLGEAYIAAYTGDMNRSRAIAAQASARFPDDAEIASIQGSLGMLLDNREMIEQSIAKMLALDPDHPEALRLRGNLRGGFEGNPRGALADFKRATEIAPADANGWSDYAEALAERGAARKGDWAMRRAISEAPNDALFPTNYAILLLNQNRMSEAKAQLDRAMELDPTLSAVHEIRGRYELQYGRVDAALDELLASSTIDPAYAEALMLLSATYYRKGEYGVALQQLDAADRLDPANSSPALIRAAIALDRYDLDTAIRSAREALRRYRSKGGIYSNLSENRGTGSYVAGAFRFLDLNDWGRYYGDRVFNSYDATSYFDQVNSRAFSPYLIDQTQAGYAPLDDGNSDLFSSLIQGLSLSPLGAASPNRHLQLFQEQFFEASINGSILAANGDVRGGVSGNVQGMTFAPVPIAFNITATRSSEHGPVADRNDQTLKNVLAIIGTELTPYDKVSIVAQHDEKVTDAPGNFGDLSLGSFGQVRQKTDLVIGTYAHDFGYHNLLQLGGSWVKSRVSTDRRDGALISGGPASLIFDSTNRARVELWSASGGWLFGTDHVDVKLGADITGRKQRSDDMVSLTITGAPPVTNQTSERNKGTFDRVYADVRATPTGSIILQGRIASTEAASGHNLDWQAAIAIEPAEGQWLRAGYFRQTMFASPFTFAPVRAAGLVPDNAPVPTGGRVQTGIARWDAEWSPHFFTAVEYQDQHFQAVSFDRPDLLMPFCLAPGCEIGPSSLSYGEGRASRISVTGNLWLTGNWGIDASWSHSHSELVTPAGNAGAIPFLPRDYGRLGVSWTDPRRIKLTAGATYVGSRRNELLNGRLNDYVSVDATANWQSPDRMFEVDLGVTNAFDKKYRIISTLPGWGRTFTASLTARF